MLEEIKEYWSERSFSYAQENLAELNGEKNHLWSSIFFKYIYDDFRGKKVLDIGCGPGIFSIILSKLNAEVIGLDYTPSMIECAKDNALKHNTQIEFCVGDAHNLIFEDNSFDLVVSRNLTWNLKDPKKAYEQWYRVLKKGGKIFNADANWYLQLYNKKQNEIYKKDREKIAKLGIPDHMTNLYPNAQKMEEIAKSLPLSKIERPKWDEEVLDFIGFRQIACYREFYQEIWNEEEKLMFNATPMFLIVGEK
ncbi:class I SAM-dependent methyltransferase [Helicobacter cappadocius]|uniref:Class I SAM-dependent methyltransferase n=1 Tax=Helicobacter cappadocius TaxID=3063998 RepID=A0AA90TC02_9HELI|nr:MULTISPECIES: class I SAM-dependent methyltransferase [unclassified Helicobacter]MDO7253405.1 class I SAM-dependent methyltransferase [Helicobacter sp. faydin-H75]MDP2539331.1 class I SAM-dependent methyltransferase [Helicobacter sp. faydin-H76]